MTTDSGNSTDSYESYDAKNSISQGGGSKKYFLIIGAIIIAVLVVAVILFGGGSSLGGSLGSLGSGSSYDPNKFGSVQDQFVLTPEDFQVSYFIVPGGKSPFTNKEVVEMVGQVPGKEYILKTGRIDGWETDLGKSNISDIGPSTYRSTVQIFETNDGASTAIGQDWFWSTDNERAPNSIEESKCSVGDQCVLRSYQTYYVESGLTKVRYEVLFRHKNVLVWVSARGLDIETKEDNAIDAAETIFDRLKNLEF
jgi:hypothetical protein